MIKPDFVTKKIEMTGTYGKFTITPLPRGYGHSLGNALRRVFYASIPGSAVSYININKVVHPFSALEGIKESALDIILNIKLLRFTTTGEGPFKMHLTAKTAGKIYAKSFIGGDVAVVNKDQFIAEITKDKKNLEIEIIIEKGVGYSPAEEKEKKAFGMIAVDSSFSPVTKVNYLIETDRIGRKSDYDKLIIEIWTDGSISPEEALKISAATLADFYSYIFSGHDSEAKKNDKLEAKTQTKEVDEKVYETIIDELDLPTRVINALLREKIETVGDLVGRGREELVNLKGVGRKSIDLIQKELDKLDVSLK